MNARYIAINPNWAAKRQTALSIILPRVLDSLGQSLDTARDTAREEKKIERIWNFEDAILHSMKKM